MPEFEDLKFLAEKTSELLDRQVASFRATHAKAGSIIAVISVFVPLFIFIIESAIFYVQLLALIPILILIYSLLLMIEILRTQKLDQGFNENQLDWLVNEDYENILLYEIGAKKSSISDNQEITKKQNSKFNKGLNSTIIAIILSFSLLTTNIFIDNKKTQVMPDKEIIKSNTDEPKKEITKDTSETVKRMIPVVPKEERIQLNEGKDPKIDINKKLNE